VKEKLPLQNKSAEGAEDRKHGKLGPTPYPGKPRNRETGPSARGKAVQ